jgi:hypothetical protein
MKKIRIVKPVNRDKDGTLVLNFDTDEASSYWLGYSRLKKLASEGDEEAKKEIKRMDASEIIEEGE